MSLGINNIYNIAPDPLGLIEKISKIRDDIGFNLNYDPEANKISLWARLPKTPDYIEVILPYDFDISFFLPQLIEVNSVFGTVKKIDFILVTNLDDMINEIKKIIIAIIARDIVYGFDNLRPLTGKNKIMGDFIFVKENNSFTGSISFNRGDVNILILPST